MDDYMRAGPLAAIEVVQEITGEDEIDLVGFCIGGILTVCTLGWLAAANSVPLRSATLLATMVDMSEIGDTRFSSTRDSSPISSATPEGQDFSMAVT